jgi:hypothetical protein
MHDSSIFQMTKLVFFSFPMSLSDSENVICFAYKKIKFESSRNW